MKNKKGFTLIELLAVIVIVSVILSITIPKVNSYINNSRKDGMITTAKHLLDAVTRDTISEVFELPISVDDITIVSTDLIKVQDEKSKSPYGGNWLYQYSYLAVINVGTDEDPDYKYFIALRDTKRYNIVLTEFSNVNRDSIVRNNSSGTKSTITYMCGLKSGQYKNIGTIKGLEKYTPPNGWNATVYSSVNCK